MSFFRSIPAYAVLLLLIACKEEEALTFDDIQAQKDAFSERIAALDDPETQEILQSVMYEISYMQELGLSNERPLADIHYINNPFAWIDDYPSIDDMVVQYVGGLVPLTSRDSFPGDVNLYQPFPYPFAHEFIWREVRLSDGTISDVSNDPFAASAAGFDARNSGRQLDMRAEGSDVPLPIQIVGQIELQVPTSTARFSFTRDEIGKSKTYDGFTVTLTGLTQTAVVLDVSDDSGTTIDIGRNSLTVSATDKTGAFLNSNSTSKGPSAAVSATLAAAFEKALGAVEAGDLNAEDLTPRLRSEFAQAQAEHGSVYTVQSNFEGVIETVEVLLATGPETRSFPLDLAVQVEENRTQEADFAGLDIPMAAVAYAHEFEYLTSADLVKEVTPDVLDATITPLSSIFWDGQERIKFFYTHNVASSLFVDMYGRIETDTADIRFLDASGTPVDPQPTYEFDTGRLEFTVDESAPRPHRVSGRFDVNLMSDIKVETFPADTLPEGISIDGNQVTWPPSNNEKVFAIDAAGRMLRSFHSIRLAQDWDVTRVMTYYYGEPAGVVVVTRGSIVPHPYQFEVDLVPPQKE